MLNLLTRVEFKQQVNQACQLYKTAWELQAIGVHVVSTDEMTGIQAIERAYPTAAMVLGEVERVEARVHSTWHTSV